MAESNNNVKKIDYLTEDDPIPRQNWVCLSFISPEGLLNCDIRGIKVRGVYATEEEATARAKYLQEVDPDFNIHVGEVGKWLPWDPDPNSQGDQVYREAKLNELAGAEKKHRDMKAKMAEERKRELMEKAKTQKQKVVKNRSNNGRDIEKIKERARKKLKERREKKERENRFRVREEDLKNDEENLNIKREQIKRAEDKIKSLDDKLNKIDELCKEMHE